jgi:hypothetical protein
VENKRSCGRPTCHCADGKTLRTQYQISVLIDGKPKTIHVPTDTPIPGTAGRRSLTPCFWARLANFPLSIAWRINERTLEK